MNKSTLNEAAAIALQVLDELQATAPTGPPSLASALLFFKCSQLKLLAPTDLAIETTAEMNSPFWDAFLGCFDQARIAGATLAQMNVILKAAEVTAPVSLLGIAVKNFAIRVALVEEAMILAKTKLTSRTQADTYIDQINADFDAAIEVVADNMDNEVYRALTTLHAATVNDLSTRSLPLPAMISFNFARRLPSLTVAQRVYLDGARGDEIIAENPGVVHPLFMPTNLRMLSVV